MDSSDLLSSLDILASSGVVLSTFMRAVLENSLTLLRDAEKFESVRFWGKISGSQAEYYIAQGLESSKHLSERKNFFW